MFAHESGAKHSGPNGPNEAKRKLQRIGAELGLGSKEKCSLGSLRLLDDECILISC